MQQIPELRSQLNDCRTKFREASNKITSLNNEVKQIRHQLDLAYSSASYRLGYVLLHEKSTFVNPRKLLKKAKTLYKIYKEKTSRVSAVSQSNTLVTQSLSQKQETPESYLSAIGWEENIDPKKPIVMGIFDEFTHTCYQYQYNLIEPRPDNWLALLDKYSPDFLFIESTWKGNHGSWQYRVAKYAHPPGNELQELVAECKNRGIPTIFWNKEDPVHFDNFKHISPYFDYVFTTAKESIVNYTSITNAKVKVLQFAAEEHLHNPIQNTNRRDAVCFAGSYYANRFKERREDQLMLLRQAKDFGLEIFDRNYNPDKTVRSDFEFPEEFDDFVIGSLPYDALVKRYKEYKVFLNVNSIIDSETMFSRRVFELLACGTPVISTPALGIEKTFGKDLVWLVKNEKEAKEALNTLMNDVEEWRRRSLQGIRTVYNYHLYTHRAEEIQKTVFSDKKVYKNHCLIFVQANSPDALYRISEIIKRQIVPNCTIECIVLSDQKEVVNTKIDGLEIMNLEENKFVDMIEKLTKEKMPDYISVISPHCVYGKYFINDAIIAHTYSKAPFVAKPLINKDIYDYEIDVALYSTVCRLAFLPDRQNILKYACRFMCNEEKAVGENTVFCADSANFYYSDTILQEDEYRSIVTKIEV